MLASDPIAASVTSKDRSADGSHHPIERPSRASLRFPLDPFNLASDSRGTSLLAVSGQTLLQLVASQHERQIGSVRLDD